MSWTMNVNPLGNLALSALVALVPILFLFIALTVLKMKGHWAAIIATSLAVGVACIAYGMPMQYAGLSVVYGALFGLFPVSWIVITALFIYNMSVKTGQFEVVKNSLATISDDRRMQALLIAFSFGAFIEGAAGFGTPVAITAAMLAGLGFNPLYAASLCLLANTAPVAFGAMLQAYVFTWIVPAGEKVVPAVAKPAEAASMTGIDSQGLLYVGIAFAAAFLITVISRILGKGLVTKEGADKAVFH